LPSCCRTAKCAKAWPRRRRGRPPVAYRMAP
jgi:hypothetical protein